MASKKKDYRVSGTRASEKSSNKKKTSDKKINKKNKEHNSVKVSRKVTARRLANKKKNSDKKVSSENTQNHERISKQHTRIASAKNISKPTGYRRMIIAAFSEVGKPRTLSRQAILNYICENFGMNKKWSTNHQFKIALKSCVTNGYLKQIKGHGANGRFALVKKQTKQKSTRRHNAAKRKDSKLSTKTPSSKQNKGVSQKNLAGQVIKTAQNKTRTQSSTPEITERQSKQLCGTPHSQQSNM